jgi:glycine dehydrogenase subunit 2
MEELFALAESNPDALHEAPITTPVGRLDEVKAAKDMRLSCE